MTETEVKTRIAEHNDSVNKFLNDELPHLMNKATGKSQFTLADWFTAQSIFQQQNFYDKAMKLLKEMRADGWDVKINCQAETLTYYGRI